MKSSVPLVSSMSSYSATSRTLAAIASDTSRDHPSSALTAMIRSGRSYRPRRSRTFLGAVTQQSRFEGCEGLRKARRGRSGDKSLAPLHSWTDSKNIPTAINRASRVPTANDRPGYDGQPSPQGFPIVGSQVKGDVLTTASVNSGHSPARGSCCVLTGRIAGRGLSTAEPPMLAFPRGSSCPRPHFLQRGGSLNLVSS